MPFLLYIAVALVAVFGVAVEMDLLAEPTRHIERAALTELPRAPVATPQQATDARALPPDATKGVITPPDAFARALAEKPQARSTATCNIEACAAAYHSFTATDCTYQPLEGARRLCDKGEPAKSAGEAEKTAASTSIMAPEPDGKQAQVTCHVDACAAAYHTFTESDCTFQPSDGPRRLCAK
jgi:cell division septation protein DedD